MFKVYVIKDGVTTLILINAKVSRCARQKPSRSVSHPKSLRNLARSLRLKPFNRFTTACVTTKVDPTQFSKPA